MTLTVIAIYLLAQPANHRPGEREDQNAAGYEVPGQASRRLRHTTPAMSTAAA
jgi:hypothetical protein